MADRIFHNRFNRAKDTVRVFSGEDCVDRLSYVDNTKLVKRFIAEGRNLAMYRAQSLYKNYEDAASSNDAALPVFEEDIVLTKARLDVLTAEVEDRKKQRSQNSSVDGSDPAVTKANDASGAVDSVSAAVVE